MATSSEDTVEIRIPRDLFEELREPVSHVYYLSEELTVLLLRSLQETLREGKRDFMKDATFDRIELKSEIKPGGTDATCEIYYLATTADAAARPSPYCRMVSPTPLFDVAAGRESFAPGPPQGVVA